MLTFLSTGYFRTWFAILAILLGSAFNFAIGKPVLLWDMDYQSYEAQNVKPDSLLPKTSLQTDTLIQKTPLKTDTLTQDSLKTAKKASKLDDIVEYNSADSLRFDIKNHQVYLFKKGVIDYGKINLQGDYVEIDFNNNEIYSEGAEDEKGKITGTPVFKENDKSFESKKLRYNFETKKGLITGVKTEEGDGFLLGEKIKKMADNTTFIQGGQYTTCQLPEPHYSFRFKKSKVIPGNMIITGPVVFEIEGVPTPLILPFGLFPNKSGQRSGILMPTYGQSAKQGYFLMNGGYYWSISDYFDLSLKGSIYTRGSWSLNPSLRYVKKYRYSGAFDFKYAINIVGTEGSPDYIRNRDFSVTWSHNQDAKARPNGKFSASVNIKTNTFNKYEVINTYENRLSNTFQSSINYSTSFNKKWYLTANLQHSQNTLSKTTSLTLPSLSLSGPQFYPFRKKGKVGNLKWYDNISLKYNVDAKNTANIPDSLLFQSGMMDLFKNGMQHKLSPSSTVKILKYFSWTNSASLTERWYTKYIDRYYQADSTNMDDEIITGHVVTNTLNGFHAVHEYSLTSSINTTLYGMYTFGQKFPIRAIRHVMKPSVSFSYHPDYGETKYGYYQSYLNKNDSIPTQYSIFDQAIYGSPASGKSGRINFSITNNLEMKVLDRNDTVTGTRKIVLIDNLTVSTNYNMALDSLRWAPLAISANTKLFKNLNIVYNAALDPYVLDSLGTRNLNQFEWDVNKRLFRLKSTSWRLGIDMNLKNDFYKKKSDNQEGDKKPPTKKSMMPWNLHISYNFTYGNNPTYVNSFPTNHRTVVQTLSFRGNIQLTPTWKINVNTGYDFIHKGLSLTTMEIYRDLHCWEMHFSWIPIGNYKSWSFGINIKSSMLKDLKLEKKKSYLDN